MDGRKERAQNVNKACRPGSLKVAIELSSLGSLSRSHPAAPAGRRQTDMFSTRLWMARCVYKMTYLYSQEKCIYIYFRNNPRRVLEVGHGAA